MAALCEKGPANTQLLSRVTSHHHNAMVHFGVIATFEATTFLLGERTSRAYGLYPSGWPGLRVGRWSAVSAWYVRIMLPREAREKGTLPPSKVGVLETKAKMPIHIT